MDPVVQGAIVAMIGAVLVATINGFFALLAARAKDRDDRPRKDTDESDEDPT